MRRFWALIERNFANSGLSALAKRPSDSLPLRVRARYARSLFLFESVFIEPICCRLHADVLHDGVGAIAGDPRGAETVAGLGKVGHSKS